MRKIGFLLFFIPIGLWAQVTDDFSDGNFTLAPTWSGSDTCFTVNASGQLQSAATTAGSAYLSTPIEGFESMEWHFWIRESFSPSGNNYADVWLVADSADLRQATRGFFLRFGAPGSNDAVELYKKDKEEMSLVCRGSDGTIASSFKMAVKVVCDASGNWTVSLDPNAWDDYAVDAHGHADPCVMGGFFGFLITYTVSNAKKFYFDDIYVGPEIIDVDPPHWIKLEVRDAAQLLLTFDEQLSAAALEPGHYHVEPAVGFPDSVCFASRPSEVSLFFRDPLPINRPLQLRLSGLSDLAGNLMETVLRDFTVYQANMNDVVINEIMADPSPPVGLPEWEYIELFNTTDFSIDLADWSLVIGTSVKVLPPMMLAPEGYLVVCKEEAVDVLSDASPICGFSSFSIANAGALIQLFSSDGALVSEVHFSDTWYRDAEKKEGGWSLEQIDPWHPCAGQRNWTASNDPRGGSPGCENSVATANVIAPQVDRVSMLGDAIVLLWFDQQMDRASLMEASHYRVLERDVGPVEVICNPINAASVELIFGAPFQEGMRYTLLVDGVTNCSGEPIDANTKVEFGIPYPVGVSEILINEILFNPIEPGVDYVELYNPTEKPFDLSELRIGVIKESFPNPADTTTMVITEESRLFMPHSYLLLSTDAMGVASHYECQPEEYLDMASFPSYPNAGGQALLVSREGVVIDAMTFSESMHDPMLKESKGVSLERVSWEAPSTQLDNWHSAAARVHYGTPGCPNSMSVSPPSPEQSEGEGGLLSLTVCPEVFSPDGDGLDDVTMVCVELQEAGYIMNVYLFDVVGTMVRHLVRGELMGRNGCFVWNGLDEQGHEVPLGLYVVVTELFNWEGKVFRYRNAVAVASR